MGVLERRRIRRSLALALTVLAAAVPVQGQQTTTDVPFLPPNGATPEDWDIAVIISPDAGCMTRNEELLLLDGGCYSNTYSNLTKAFSVKITSYGHKGANWMVDLTEYEDNCWTPSYDPPTRTLTMGQCERFAGAVRAQISVVERSVRCKGLDCSKLPVGVQEFFPEVGCRGFPMRELGLRVPLRGECLRWRNGTQTYLVDNIMDNMTRTDYPNSTSCNWDGVKPKTEYRIEGDDCTELCSQSQINEGACPAPRSFKWRVERIKSGITAISAAGGAPWLHGAAAAVLWLAAAASPRQARPGRHQDIW